MSPIADSSLAVRRLRENSTSHATGAGIGGLTGVSNTGNAELAQVANCRKRWRGLSWRSEIFACLRGCPISVSKTTTAKAVTNYRQPYSYRYNPEFAEPDWRRLPGYKDVS